MRWLVVRRVSWSAALPSKHEALAQCWVDVGSASKTLGQRQPNIGPTPRVCWVIPNLEICYLIYRTLIGVVNLFHNGNDRINKIKRFERATKKAVTTYITTLFISTVVQHYEFCYSSVDYLRYLWCGNNNILQSSRPDIVIDSKTPVP